VSQRPRQPITEEMRGRFARAAPGALRRRSPEWLRGAILSWAQLPLLGGIGAAGLFAWGWSPLTAYFMLLAGFYASMLACTLRWLLSRSALRAQVDRHNEDRFVWAMVDALRAGREDIETGALSRYRAGTALALDWAFGACALATLTPAFAKSGIGSPEALLANAELRGAMLVAVALPLLQALLALRPQPDPERSGLEGFGAGVYGFLSLLFALLFAAGFNTPEGLRKLMIGLDLAVIAVGGIALVGCAEYRAEAAWLRAHLGGRAGPAVATGA
jgi:hypothetical protein